MNCPSCGGPIQFQSAASLVAVCPYCRAAVIKNDFNMETFGKVAELLPEKTSLQLGAGGRYQNVSFRVLGRIQLAYDEGHWSEWYLAFNDGRAGWLAQAMGQTGISFYTPTTQALPSYENLSPGDPVMLNGKEFSVTTIDDVIYRAAEGELPGPFPLGEEVTLIDCGSDDGRFATLDYSETPTQLYVGEWLEFKSLSWVGLRA